MHTDDFLENGGLPIYIRNDLTFIMISNENWPPATRGFSGLPSRTPQFFAQAGAPLDFHNSENYTSALPRWGSATSAKNEKQQVRPTQARPRRFTTANHLIGCTPTCGQHCITFVMNCKERRPSEAGALREDTSKSVPPPSLRLSLPSS